MLNIINRAELVAILVALRECQQYEDECIATDSRCSCRESINTFKPRLFTYQVSRLPVSQNAHCLDVKEMMVQDTSCLNAGMHEDAAYCQA